MLFVVSVFFKTIMLSKIIKITLLKHNHMFTFILKKNVVNVCMSEQAIKWAVTIAVLCPCSS